MKLTHLTDKTLLADTKTLAQKERTLTTQILWHLREIDHRKLYSDLKYSSLWEYTTKELGYSEGTAFRRITAARALGAMPELETKLNQGSLNLTALTSVLKEFKDESIEKKREIFAAIENKSPIEVKEIIRERAGKPKKKIAIEVDEETLLLIQELKSLQPHKTDAVKEALKEAVEKAKQQRFKTFKNLNLQLEVKSKVAKKSSIRNIQRELFVKAGHQCQNCHSKHALEIDHIHPKALGGSNHSTNLRILCRNCNQRARMKAGLSMTSESHSKLSGSRIYSSSGPHSFK